jgi:hypothetical protein
MDSPSAIAIAQQRAIAEIQHDRDRLEVLAANRRDLKIALEEISRNVDGAWVASSNASFFRFGNDSSKLWIQRQLDDIEDELKELCVKLKGVTADQ